MVYKYFSKYFRNLKLEFFIKQTKLYKYVLLFKFYVLNKS